MNICIRACFIDEDVLETNMVDVNAVDTNELVSAGQIQHIFITTTDQVNADITDIDSKIIEINVIAVTTSGLRPGPYQDLSLALQRLSLLMGRPACV